MELVFEESDDVLAKNISFFDQRGGGAFYK